MPMPFRTLIKQTTLTLSLCGALLALVPAPAQALVEAQSLPQLAPEREHKKTLRNLAKTLRVGHFRKLAIDDSFSSQLFDTYLERLDKNRLYFLASDIKEFEASRYKLDTALDRSDLSFAFSVFNRYQLRSQERVQHLLKRLDQGLDTLDFDRDEQLETDRSEAPWATSKEELDDLWRKRLKSTVLNFKLSDKTLEEAAVLLRKRYENQLKRISLTNNGDVFQSYANALAALYGPHTQYFSPRRSENFDIDMRLSLEGIGAVLQTEYENTKIVRLIPAGPAEKGGQLQPSDLITGVAQGEDGEMVDVVGWRLDEVVDLIRGPKGSTVRLQVIPADSENKLSKEIVIVRNTVKLEEQAAQKRLIEVERGGKTHKLGLISIPTFYVDFAALRDGNPDYRSTTRDVEKLLNELLEEQIEGLIIDLRDNGGGALREAVDLAGLFIPQGPVVQIKDSWGQVRVEFDQDPKHYQIPLAVIVNRLSASASEIFAGAIQDYNRGIILGSQTFGKGTVQILHPLNSGQLKLTRAKFYRISGDSTQHKGIMPHISLPSLYDPEEIGESSAKSALPWDQVKPLPHLSFPAFDHLLDSIDQAHRSRLDGEPDFALILERIDRQRQKRLDRQLPLNEQALRQLRDEDDRWKLNLENRRRLAKNQPPLESLAELEQAAVSQQNNDPDNDVLLRESGRVLLDLVSQTVH